MQWRLRLDSRRCDAAFQHGGVDGAALARCCGEAITVKTSTALGRGEASAVIGCGWRRGDAVLRFSTAGSKVAAMAIAAARRVEAVLRFSTAVVYVAAIAIAAEVGMSIGFMKSNRRGEVGCWDSLSVLEGRAAAMRFPEATPRYLLQVTRPLLSTFRSGQRLLQ